MSTAESPLPEPQPEQPSMRLVREPSPGLRERITAGNPDAVARQHALGKRTARERLALLLDDESFTEVEIYRRHQARGMKMSAHAPHTDGVVTGYGTIEGRRVFVYAQDF